MHGWAVDLTHHIGPLQPGGSWGTSRFYLARAPARALVVLVHGFKTQSDGTWPLTDMMLFADERFDEADVILYDYDSTTDNIPTEVRNLRGAIDQAWGGAPLVVSAALAALGASLGARAYERLILVGYSLGGYVVRALALRAARGPTYPAWLEPLRLLLYAPAHLGSGYLAFFRTDGILDGWKLRRRHKTLGAANVLVKGSRFLTTLKRRTEALVAQGRASLAARTVLFGWGELIVVVGRFDCDPKVRRKLWKDHVNVQRASDAYGLPLDLIEEQLP